MKCATDRGIPEGMSDDSVGRGLSEVTIVNATQELVRLLGLCVGVALPALSCNKQSPAIAAEIALWGPTHRVVRYVFHRASPTQVLLCQLSRFNARKLLDIGGFIL